MELDLSQAPAGDGDEFVERAGAKVGQGAVRPRPNHFRILTLPHADDLDAAISRIGRFLTGYRQS